MHSSLRARSGFVAGGYTTCRKDYAEEETSVHDGRELQHQFQRVLACGKSGPSSGMRNSSAFISRDEADKSVLWVEKVLLLFPLKSHT